MNEIRPQPSEDHPEEGKSLKSGRGANLRLFKRVMVALIGGTVTLTGIALLVLPGPAFIVIPVGLTILATEFLWAKRWLRKARGMAARCMQRPPSDARAARQRPDGAGPPGGEVEKRR